MLSAITLNGNAYMQHVQKLNVEHVVVAAWIPNMSEKSADGAVDMPVKKYHWRVHDVHCDLNFTLISTCAHARREVRHKTAKSINLYLNHERMHALLKCSVVLPFDRHTNIEIQNI